MHWDPGSVQRWKALLHGLGVRAATLSMTAIGLDHDCRRYDHCGNECDYTEPNATVLTGYDAQNAGQIASGKKKHILYPEFGASRSLCFPFSLYNLLFFPAFE